MRFDRLRQFEVLRVVFCLMVVMFHIFCFLPVPDNKMLKIVCANGYLGVEMFFVMSGFFVSVNYKNRIGQMGIKAFVIGRLRKIYPMTVFSVIVGFILVSVYENMNLWGGGWY